MFYSAKDNVFLDPSLRESYEPAETWPDDAVEVEHSVFEEFALNEAPDGKQRTADSNGLPVWEDIPPPTDEQKAEQERQWRDSELSSTDVYLLEDFPISAEDKTRILNYRQLLRDYPQQPDFPNGTRPIRPEV